MTLQHEDSACASRGADAHRSTESPPNQVIDVLLEPRPLPPGIENAGSTVAVEQTS